MLEKPIRIAQVIQKKQFIIKVCFLKRELRGKVWVVPMTVSKEKGDLVGEDKGAITVSLACLVLFWTC